MLFLFPPGLLLIVYCVFLIIVVAVFISFFCYLMFIKHKNTKPIDGRIIKNNKIKSKFKFKNNVDQDLFLRIFLKLWQFGG